MDASRSDSNLDTPSLGLVQEGIESAISLAGVGVWESLIPENVFSCSDGFYQLLGMEPEAGRQVVHSWIERVHPEDDERRKIAYAGFLEGLTPNYEEAYRVRSESGQWLTVLSRARWVARDDDKPGRRVLGYVIDVTAHSEDVDRLKASEERFRMSVSALHGVVYDLDLRTQRSERHGLQRMLGYEVLQGNDGFDGWLSVMHPDDVSRLTAAVAAGRASGKGFELTYRVRHQDGRWRHVRQRGTYLLADGKSIRAYGVIEDITDAESRRQQLQMQAAIIERMSEGVMLVARDSTILFANPALEKMFGYERGELAGVSAQELSFRSRADFENLVRAVFEGTENDRTSIIDLEGRRRDSSMCPMQGYFSSIVLDDNRCVVAVFTDITERKQLERELMQAAVRTQHRAGGDLHEGLGQQLAGIAMMLQGLGQRATNAGVPTLGNEVGEVVNLVNAAIGNTRSLARGLSPVRPSRDGLVEGFEELVNQIHDRYGVRVKLELALPRETILDENTASNLYRIAQEGVLNAARHANAQNIQLSFRAAGPEVELLIVDDGKGFDPLQFTRGSTGLRLMRFRSQLIGGYLSIESRPGAGTAVRCRCPVKLGREVA
ncbi:MAG: PAS domain-containing protein [Pseudomonadota bacterium]